MTTVTAEWYDSVLCALCRAIGQTDYFSGSVAAADGSWRLTATVLVSWKESASSGTIPRSAACPDGVCGPQRADWSVRSAPTDSGLPVEVSGGTCQSERMRRTPGARGRIVDLLPVWWEFHTLDGSGETLNDFSFARMKAGLRRSDEAAA